MFVFFINDYKYFHLHLSKHFKSVHFVGLYCLTIYHITFKKSSSVQNEVEGTFQSSPIIFSLNQLFNVENMIYFIVRLI